jgi:hypothetical protein
MINGVPVKARAPINKKQAANVRSGSKADIGLPSVDVRFTPKSGHSAATFAFTLFGSRRNARQATPATPYCPLGLPVDPVIAAPVTPAGRQQT